MKWLLFLIFTFYCSFLLAQNQFDFKPLRYDDDFQYLKNDTLKGIYESSKYISLDGNSYASLGGELRFQYQYVRNENWGDAKEDKDGYILNRYLLHSDWHLGKSVRLFFQLQSSISGSRIDPSPVDENTLDIHQAFVDFNILEDGNRQFTIRPGRQELLYGSQRLISVREGPNNRLAFDAIRFLYKSKKFRNDIFYSHPVASQPKIFDDHFNEDAKLWGSYAVINNVGFLHSIDLYYLGIWKREMNFNDIQGKETRHSIGTRIWKNEGQWRYDFEAVYQFGKLGDNTINAWTLSSNTTYQFTNIKFNPKVGLKTELISGDQNKADGKLQSFNPLFPRGAYFGLVALIGPSNLFDIHPAIELEISEKAALNFDLDLFWRISENDGVYAPNMQLIYNSDSTEKFIGTQPSSSFSYEVNPFLSFTAEVSWFEAGPYVKDAGTGKDVFFTAFTAQLKF